MKNKNDCKIQCFSIRTLFNSFKNKRNLTHHTLSALNPQTDNEWPTSVRQSMLKMMIIMTMMFRRHWMQEVLFKILNKITKKTNKQTKKILKKSIFGQTAPYIHTYIIDHYKPSVRIIDLVSQTTYVVCVICIRKWRHLQFKVDSERLFEKLFMAILFTLRVFARNLLRGNRRRNISFWWLAWDSNPGFSSNKPTHYLLDRSDFTSSLHSH